MRTQPAQGCLGIATLPRVVRDLWSARATGILHLSRGAKTKQIFFKNGNIVFAATNVERERIGERLVRAGKIKRSVLNLALRVMERTRERLGKTMVDWGWVSHSEMQRRIAQQIKDIIYSVFAWNSGDYRFEPADQPVAPGLGVELELQAAEVILEGCRRVANLEAIREGVGDPNTVLRLGNGNQLDIPVDQQEGLILARVDGHTTISEILSGSPLAEPDTLRRVYALLLAGILERDGCPSSTPSPSPSEAHTDANSRAGATRSDGDDEQNFRDAIMARYAAMQFGNYYERLEVHFNAPQNVIRGAYQQVMQSLEPGPHYRDRIQDLEGRLEKVKRKVTKAYRVLTDPERRRTYDTSLSLSSPERTMAPVTTPQDDSSGTAITFGEQTPSGSPSMASQTPSTEADRKEAQARYSEGKLRMEAGNYFDAVSALNDAVRLDPDRGEYHRVLAELLSQNPSCTEASQEHFERALELNPGDREASIGLATLLKQAGHAEQKRSPAKL